jgi:hypothetical protein
MKPNGKTFVVRVMLFAVCTVFLLSDISNAESVHGTFKLPVEAHWGKMVLAPGDYEFSVDTSAASRVLVVRSKDTGWRGMILAGSIGDVDARSGSALKLVKGEDGMYVQTLYLNDARVALGFAMPKPVMTKIAKAASPAMASASGTH